MAQSRVTEFFNVRKRSSDLHPAKRRKIERVDAFDFSQSVVPTVDESTQLTGLTQDEDKKVQQSEIKVPPSNNENDNLVRRTSREHKQTKERTVEKYVVTECTTIDTALKPFTEVISEKVTSLDDDHGSLPTTPVKRAKATEEECTVRQKRAKIRQPKVLVRNPLATPENSGGDDVAGGHRKQIDTKDRPPMVVRKRLNMKPLDDTYLKKDCKTEPATQPDAVLASLPTAATNPAPENHHHHIPRPRLSNLPPPCERFRGPLGVTLPSSTSTPQSRPSNIAPAYERFHALAQPGPPGLTLPYKYKLLHEMFRSADTAVSMLHNRAEICTFDKLKAAVQEMVSKTFELKNLGQIKAVYPTAYTLRQEKDLPTYGRGHTSSQYQLTVEPNLEHCSEIDTTKPREKIPFTASSLVERRRLFHNNLVNIVKKHHKEFLTSHNPRLNVPDEKITRWHPKFNVDSVPNIDPAVLPTPPEVKAMSSASDVLKHANGKLPNKVENALRSISLKYPPKKQTMTVASSAQLTSSAVPSGASFKGVPDSLLERIRAKEAKKLEEGMMRKPEEEKHREMLARLPDIARIIRTHFVTQKKTALSLASVAQAIVDSYKSSISISDAADHLTLLTQLVPDWLTLVTIRKGKFIKMNKDTDLHNVVNRLKGMLK